MSSKQATKGGTGATGEDRKSVLKQMRVRTKLKTDKSWIHQQSSDDEKDDAQSPLSPQKRKSMLWSPTPDSNPEIKPNRTSGVFTAKEVVTTTDSPTLKSSNNQFSYSSNETDTSQSQASKISPPPSTTGGRPASSYIIRGQPFNAVSQVKAPPSFNGFQKSTTTTKSASLPRVPTASGYKMSTEEYKKLAPYNVRNKSGDLSDDETLHTSQEQVKRTEHASSILKNKTSKDRSYVLSAAKRDSGIVTQDSPSPFLAKRVDVQEEDTDTSKKSQTLPPSLTGLTSYLSADASKFENNWKETQKSKQSSSQASPPRLEVQNEDIGTNKKSQTIPSSLTGYLSEDASRFENNWKETQKSKQTSSQMSQPRVDVQYEDSSSTNNKSQTLPPSLTAFLSEDASRFENSWKEAQKSITQTVSQTSYSSTTERSSSPQLTSYSVNTSADGRNSPVKHEGKITLVREQSDSKPVSKQPPAKESATNTQSTRTEKVEVTGNKSGDLPKNLAAYLYEDGNSYEKKWKANQKEPSTFPTPVPSVSHRPESPKLTSWNTETTNSSIKPEAGKISVLRTESDTATPKSTESKSSTTSTVTTTAESGKTNADIPKLTSYNEVIDIKNSAIKAGPGKITLLREESHDSKTDKPPMVTTDSSSTTNTVGTKLERTKDKTDKPDIPKLTSFNISQNITEAPSSGVQAGPGKITLIRENSSPADKAMKKPETTTTTSSPKIVIETVNDSTSPMPVPQADTNRASSDQPLDLISWSDLDDNNEKRLPTEKPAAAPKPIPRSINKDGEKATPQPSLVLIDSDSDGNRFNQPSKSTATSTVYKVSESLDDPQPNPISTKTTSESSNPGIKIETISEQPKTPELPKTERSSSPRPSPRSKESTTNTETRYRVPETIDGTMLESSYMRPSPRSRETPRETSHAEARYRIPEDLDDTMLEPVPARPGPRTTVSTSRSTDPLYREYLLDNDNRTTRTVSSSSQKTITTTVETRYDNNVSKKSSQYDPQSSSNKGVLFVKEYVNSRESMKSPTTGSFPNFSGDSDMVSYSSNSSYLYNSAPRRSSEGPCTYCGREIKDCPKIILEHLNIYCHDYCFKCGICNKPMGDLIDSLFIHRNVVHCETCYEKLF